MNALMDNTAARLAALDLSEENARIEALEAERRDIADAIERGDARKAEISRELSQTWRGDDGVAVADALLSAESASLAAEQGVSRNKLLQERTALQAGTGELRRRDADLGAEIATVQSQAAAKVGEVVAPIVAMALGEARAAAGKMLEAFAALAGIAAATRTGQGDVDRIGQAIAGMMTGGSLIDRQNAVAVPMDVREMLAALGDKGPALRPALLSSVGIPDDHNLIMAMGAAADMIARRK